MIAPNKNTIYPEYLPKEMAPLNTDSRLDQIMNFWIDSKNCRIIDLRSTLINAKKSHQVDFETDTHWNDNGAFLGYQALANIMKEDFPEITVHKVSEYSQEKIEYHGDMTSANFGHFDLSETTSIFKPKNQPEVFSRFFTTPDGMNVGSYNAIATYKNNTDLPDALIFYDLFFNLIFPFLKDNLHEAFYLWSLGIDMEMVETVKPDYLIIEITERNLGLRLFSLPTPN